MRADLPAYALPEDYLPLERQYYARVDLATLPLARLYQGLRG